MSKFPALSGVLNSGERAEDPQNCLQSSAQNLAWAALGWAVPIPADDALGRLLEHALSPERCAQCNSVLRIEVCGGMILEFCDECDPEYDA